MSGFIKWVFAYNTPDWVLFVVGLLFASSVMALIALTIWSFNAGLWLIPVVIWIVLPAYALIRAYMGRDDE